MTDLKNSNFKDNDRVELSGYFDVYTHGNGFQLRTDGMTYSIIPIKMTRKSGLGQKIGWEVNNDKNRFEELRKAIEYILEEEEVSVKVHSITEFYNLVDSE